MSLKRQSKADRRRKKVIILFIASLVLIASVIYFTLPFITFKNSPLELNDVIKLVQPNSEDNKKLSTPRLVIPRIGVSAFIQDVGTTKEGDMDVPTNMEDVGWYKDGSKIGESGNAVIAGHVSSWRGPAVFAKLDDVKPGDEVYVITKDNDLQKFAVIDRQDYEVSNAPLEKIFGSTDKKMLNLITCSGGWNWREQSFSKRLVVFAEFVNQQDL